jgi:hypothetical protein
MRVCFGAAFDEAKYLQNSSSNPEGWFGVVFCTDYMKQF